VSGSIPVIDDEVGLLCFDDAGPRDNFHCLAGSVAVVPTHVGFRSCGVMV
jgi:hypothetical protein